MNARTLSDAAIAFARHDHSHCAEGVITRAETLSAARGVRLTPVRRRTLEILLEAHKAMGAYEVLDRLAHSGFGNQPPVAYRALEFLVEQGLAHQVRRLNAFAACMHPGQAHVPAFFICDTCHAVAEAPGEAVSAAVAATAATIGFAVGRISAEATGLCPVCASVGAEPRA